MIHVGRNLLHCTVYSESKLVQLAACSITEYSISGVSTAEILRGVGGAPVMDTVRGTVQYVRELPSHRNSEVRVVTCEYVRSTRSRMSIRCGSAMNIVLYEVRSTRYSNLLKLRVFIQGLPHTRIIDDRSDAFPVGRICSTQRLVAECRCTGNLASRAAPSGKGIPRYWASLCLRTSRTLPIKPPRYCQSTVSCQHLCLEAVTYTYSVPT